MNIIYKDMSLIEIILCSSFGGSIGIMFLKAYAIMLDVPVINNWFRLNKERESIAVELKLSLMNDIERQKINKKIARRILHAIFFIIVAGLILYLLLSPFVSKLLNL